MVKPESSFHIFCFGSNSFVYVLFMIWTERQNGLRLKGAEDFERPGQTIDQLGVFGTIRTSKGPKSKPNKPHL